MSFKTTFLLVFLLPVIAFSQNNTPFIEVKDSHGQNNVLVDCDYPVDANRCFVLEANYTIIKETTSYDVTSIPFQNLSGLTNETVINISADDKWSGVIPLPFDFCFYTEGNDTLLIGDNGIVSFNTALALGDSEYFAGTIPNTSMPTNAIFGVFHDLTNDDDKFGCTDDPNTPENECGEIKTYVTGTAPTRTFVISYENLNHFNCESSRSTSQIVLYEGSNIIEVFVKEKPINCESNPTLYRKNALIGIQNIDGTLATTPPNRNTGIWSATNEAWRFTPNGTPVTKVQWRDENNIIISTGDQITVCPTKTTTYTASVTYDLCIGAPIVLQDTINVEIDLSFPIAIDNTVIVCDVDTLGSEVINLAAYDVLMMGTQVGLVPSYYTSLSDAQTESNPISNPNTYELTNPSETIYVRLLRGVGCFDVGTLAINLEELASSQLSQIAVCDVANDNSELITFSNYTTSIIGSQTGVAISYHTTQDDADNDSDPITDLTAANGASVFVRLTLIPDGTCPNIVEIPINLLPVPIVEPIDVELCSNIAIYNLTQHESEVQSDNTEPLNFTYHLYKSWAESNINPFDPTHPTTPIKPAFYVLNGATQIWVRSFTSSGCVEVFPINFTYINGVTVQNEKQVRTGTIFDLTASINDMVADLTGITYQFYDSLDGAKTQDPTSLIADPVNFAVTNPETNVFVVFTNTSSGCRTIGDLLLDSAGFGGGGGGGGDLQVCDSANDSEELVTLSDYDAQLIFGYDDAQYMRVSYYLLEAQADAGTSPITEINITAPTIIYARIALVFKGVELDHIVKQITLDFQSTILLNPVSDVICDEFANNREIHDLTQYEDQITTVPGAIFTYKNTNGTIIINPDVYDVVGPTRIINVFVATPDGCTTETTITITFHPKIITTNTTLNACDVDNNKEELFDLNEALPNVNTNYNNYTATYFLTLLEAEVGDPASEIATPTAYIVTANSSVFVRLFDPITTCYATARIDLAIISVPEIKTAEITVCDFENDAVENTVTLSKFNPKILGAQTGITLTYHTSLSDANAKLNPITTATITDGSVLYVNLEAPGKCTTVGEITFKLQAAPIVNDINVIVCDNFEDGKEKYNLTLSNSDIISDPENHTFRYFTTEINAFNNSSPLSINHLITSVPENIYVRVTNTATGCFSIATMTIDFTFPIAVKDTELTACDADRNLSEEFDLTTAIPAMLPHTAGLYITYYSNEVAAQTANAAFLITTPETHNTASETDNVYVRFDAVATGCFSIGKLVLKVLATPKLIDNSHEICDSDFDGSYTLDLDDLKTLIIQNPTNLNFTYYTSLSDADNQTAAIVNTSNYAIPNTNHTIYIRVLNQFGCSSIATVIINIKESTTVETVTDILESCDNDLNNYALFDLTSFESQFTNETGATFRYYNTRTDANLEQNQIPNPTVHENVSPNSQIIYVRVSVPNKCDNITSFGIKTIHITPPTLTEATYCAGTSVVLDIGPGYTSYIWSTLETTQAIEVTAAGTYNITLIDSNGCTDTFDIVVTELPLPTVIATTITECDYDGAPDGFMTFELHDYDDQLTGNNANGTTHFFLSQADLDADVNEQNATFTNTTNPQVLYVKVVDNNTYCVDSTTLTLNSSFEVLTPGTLEICDTNFDGNYIFNLSELNDLVIANTTGLTFEYYTTYNNARNQDAPVFGSYTLPSNNHVIYVRVENKISCAYITSVVVGYKADALVNVVTEILESCDDDLDTFAIFDLTTFENLVSTEVNATFRYYNSESDAYLEQNEITTPTSHQNITPNSQTVYVRVSVADKCDNITSFEIKTIHIAPPSLTEATFCAGTSVVLDVGADYTSYTWSTSETTQAIEVTAPGTYSVTLVDSKGCTDTFEVVVTKLALPNAFNHVVIECDYDGIGGSDGLMEFNLRDYDPQLTGNNTNVSTQFFLSQSDLDGDLNAQNTTFTTTINPQILYVKVIDNNTHCFSVAQLTLEASFINPKSALLELCDELDSEDGINIFDLTLSDADVITGLPTNTQVAYYENYDDALLKQNPINTSYTNKNPYSQTIFSRVENTRGCFGINEVLLVVNDLPNIEEDEDVIYCLNSYPETITLYAGVINDSPSNYTYHWTNGEHTASIEINAIGVYTVTITSTEGCSKSRAITVVPSNIATIERIEIEDAQTVNKITVFVIGEGDYEYALDSKSGPYQDSNIFTNVNGGLHTLYVRDKNGCGIVSEAISVISIPKFFTPNNDSYNDTWLPKGLSKEFQSNVSLYVYDRYGKLLKQLDPFGNGWDGTYTGHKLPGTDYWYTLEYIETFSRKQRQLKGHFSLKR